ncbi:MAG: HAD-IC family P-type ATPase, partial [Candidatus Aminicenantes bacterium]|nr:HAD-IC family P-type ATPase [Candidatus Aminicenantes bacterium]
MNATPWHALSTTEALERLQTDSARGLSSDEARARLERYGPNELKAETMVSPWTVFFRQFSNVLIIILLVATVLSAAVGELFDAALILVIVLFSALLGFFQEYRAERALEALKKMLSPVIRVIRDGREQDIATKDLVPGDILLLEAGYKVPADARLIESASLKCDEAPLTGESLPVGKDTKPLPSETSVSDRRNIVFTGTIVSYGRGKAAVVATGAATEFGKIAEEVSHVEQVETPLEKRTREIGKSLGIIALSICLLIVVISLGREALDPHGQFNLPFLIQLIMFSVALAVAAVPEALAAIVTGSLAIGVHQMAKRNALIRKMPAVETLGCTTVICSDKTGTLTKGEMTVRKVFVSNRMAEVTGAGYAPRGDFKGAGGAEPLDDATLKLLLEAGVLNNDASLDENEGKWFIKGDPTEGALIVAAAKAGLKTIEIKIQNERIEEIPFSSERKRMTTIHRLEDGRTLAFMKGAPEIVLERCTKI